MDAEAEEKYIKAGKIAAKVRDEAAKMAKPGAKLLKIAEFIESETRRLGGEPAFPANLSLNEIAAHYTPVKNDETVIPDGSILKIDVGVHVDGYVADTAKTIAFSDEMERLSNASRDALEEAIKLVKSGAKIADISKRIEAVITSQGYKPVSNLTGHGLERYFLHAEPRIPNVATRNEARLKDGMAIAIEPFATSGMGEVRDSAPALIFMLLGKKPLRGGDARKAAAFAESFKGLPFAERWLPFDSTFKARLALRELREKGVLYDYPPLKEKGMVSQHEHTILVKDEPIVTTL
ncbi:MAG: type II methionyl aminopeptidase [Candidatus Aenigmarchaeota archaeon]|nr:type II methionyl aminopeptidase [Candidatus Aenigmarchaeota archaeon]